MIREFIALKADVEALKTQFGTALRVGPVEAVDAAKGFRVKWEEDPDGQPFLSPWYPHPESGGATSTWFPLSKGQVVGIINPDGDPRQGILLRGGFSDVNPPPSQDLEENRYEFSGLTFSMKDGKLTIHGDVEVRGNVRFFDGVVGHNDKDIGATHKHTEVMPGGGTSGVPTGLGG